jgi:cytochrome b
MDRQSTSLGEYPVWDKTTRWFHWINFVCVIGLLFLGTVILNAGDLGASNDGKILLKSTHVVVGYVFTINLLWRLAWGFIGGPYSRWKSVLPFGRGFVSALTKQIRDIRNGTSEPHAGHSPLGRIAVTVILLFLSVQGVTGLVLAGTDVYMPPFGNYFSEWVAGPDMDPQAVRPYAPETVNEQSYNEMRAFREPFISTHVTNYYFLLGLILLHIVAVIFSETREGGSIISAMFTGKKTLAKKPE